jgi:adenylate cyclase
MNLEIERKFIVNESRLNCLDAGSDIIQGYLSNSDRTSIRVRQKDAKAYLTIKSGGNALVRTEFEYSIELNDAKYMLENLCLNLLVEKTRYNINYCQHHWTVDIFKAQNKGLVLAEIELNSVNEKFERPEWLLEEVTNNTHYYNCFLAKHPYANWSALNIHSS